MEWNFSWTEEKEKETYWMTEGLEVIPGNPGSKCQFIVERKEEMK